MTVKEVIKEQENNFYDFEIWMYSDKTSKLHTDYIKNLDSEYSVILLQDLEIKDFYIMDESEYNSTILANSSIKEDFFVTYDNKDAKILVIMLPFNAELPE